MRLSEGRVGLPGLEPGTSSLSVKRSNRLSYSPEWECDACVATSKTLPDERVNVKSDQFEVKPTRSPPVTFTMRL